MNKAGRLIPHTPRPPTLNKPWADTCTRALPRELNTQLTVLPGIGVQIGCRLPVLQPLARLVSTRGAGVILPMLVHAGASHRTARRVNVSQPEYPYVSKSGGSSTFSLMRFARLCMCRAGKRGTRIMST